MVVEAAEARCWARCNHPLSTLISRRSCCRRRPQGQIIGLANAGGDTINTIKQASEFGIVTGGQKLAGLLVFITDVHALGLQTAQGLHAHRGVLLGSANDQTRAFAEEYRAAANGGKMPHHGAGGRLRVGAALPEGGAGG